MPSRANAFFRKAWRDDRLHSRNVASFVLLAAWPWIGLFGHEPWKPDEAYTFGLVYSYLEGKDWLVPVLADSYFLEKPPLFYWVATLTARLFGGVLPLPDAARLAIPLFLYLTLGFLAATGGILFGRGRAWVAPVVLIGAAGLFANVHILVTDVALLAGLSIGLFGLALGPQRPVTGGLAMGTGAAIAFMSKGLLGPGMLALTTVALMVRREGRSWPMIRCLLVAIGIGLPLMLVWPVMLYLKSPELFMQWFWVNNFGRYVGFVRLGHRHGVWFYPFTLFWLSFPLWPFAITGVAQRIRKSDARSEVALPLAAFVVWFAILVSSTDSRTLYALPLLLPLALLAATGLDSIGAAAVPYLHRGVVIFFSIAVGALWLLWLGALLHWPAWLEQLFEGQAPDFSMPFVPVFVGVAALGTLLWVWAAFDRGIDLAAAVRDWSVGLTVCWLLLLTLGMPLLDYVKSYRSEVAALRTSLPTGANCVASAHLGEPLRAMLHYYAGVITRPVEFDPSAVTCDCQVVQVRPKDGEDLPSPRVWQKIWQGARPGDTQEALELYRRR